jgi:hypothetical protein
MSYCKYQSKIVDSIAVAAPAVRMVVVSVSVSRDPAPGAAGDFLSPPDADGYYSWVEVYPVLALVAAAERHYATSRASALDPGLPPTHDAAEGEGWVFAQHITAYDVLVYTDDYGICPAAEAFDSANEAYRVLLCLWPESEDEARLAAIVAELTDEAKVKECFSADIKNPECYPARV